MEQVVLISGHLEAGKSGLAKLLADGYGYHWFSSSDHLRELARAKGRADDRASLQALGDELDAETNDSWLRTAVMAQCERLGLTEDDRRLNKARGILTRAQQQMGIPLSQETKQKISLALTGRTLPAATRAKISASLKAFHSAAKK